MLFFITTIKLAVTTTTTMVVLLYKVTQWCPWRTTWTVYFINMINSIGVISWWNWIELTYRCRLTVRLIDDQGVLSASHCHRRHWFVVESMSPATSHRVGHKTAGQGCWVKHNKVTVLSEIFVRWFHLVQQIQEFNILHRPMHRTSHNCCCSWKRLLFSAWEKQYSTICYKNGHPQVQSRHQ